MNDGTFIIPTQPLSPASLSLSQTYHHVSRTNHVLQIDEGIVDGNNINPVLESNSGNQTTDTSETVGYEEHFVKNKCLDD